jgi:hypothetical protein
MRSAPASGRADRDPDVTSPDDDSQLKKKISTFFPDIMMPELLFGHRAREWTSIRAWHCYSCPLPKRRVELFEILVRRNGNCVASELITTALLGDLCVSYDHHRISRAETANRSVQNAPCISETSYYINDRPGKDYQ